MPFAVNVPRECCSRPTRRKCVPSSATVMTLYGRHSMVHPSRCDGRRRAAPLGCSSEAGMADPVSSLARRQRGPSGSVRPLPTGGPASSLPVGPPKGQRDLLCTRKLLFFGEEEQLPRPRPLRVPYKRPSSLQMFFTQHFEVSEYHKGTLGFLSHAVLDKRGPVTLSQSVPRVRCIRSGVNQMRLNPLINRLLLFLSCACRCNL